MTNLDSYFVETQNIETEKGSKNKTLLKVENKLDFTKRIKTELLEFVGIRKYAQ